MNMESNGESFPHRPSNELIYSRVSVGPTSGSPTSSEGITQFVFAIQTKFLARSGEQFIEGSAFCLAFPTPLDQPHVRTAARDELLMMLRTILAVELEPADAGALADKMLDCAHAMASGMESTVGRALHVTANLLIVVEHLDQIFDDDEEGEEYEVDDDDSGFLPATEDDGGFLPAAEESIKGLERIRVDQVLSKECAVCLDDILVGSEAARLPCLHYFHGECIIQWLHISKLCPLCRFEVS